MARLEEIDKDTLKVGDTVGFQTENYFYNFGYFRYPTTTETIIERISSDGAVFVLSGGFVFGRERAFYRVTEEAERQNKAVECAKDIYYYLRKIEIYSGKFLHKDDDFIIKSADTLKKLYEELLEEQQT